MEDHVHPLKQARLRQGWSQEQAIVRIEAAARSMNVDLPVRTHWRSVMNRLCGWLSDAIGVLSRRVAGGVATYVLCGCCSGYVL